MKWVREYEIEVDEEILDELAETYGSGALLDAITRNCDMGDLKELYLYEKRSDPQNKGKFDAVYEWGNEDDGTEDEVVFGPVNYKVKETDFRPVD